MQFSDSKWRWVCWFINRRGQSGHACLDCWFPRPSRRASSSPWSTWLDMHWSSRQEHRVPHKILSFKITIYKNRNVKNGLSDCCSIDRSIRNFWEVENIGTDKACTRVLTEEEKLALQKVENSLQIVDERYQISVPWKSERPQLPNNRQMAVSRKTWKRILKWRLNTRKPSTLM